MLNGVVENLYHYPIKGLSAQSLGVVTLSKGQGFPMDRAFGFARPGSGFDPQNPKPLPKTKFIMLARDAALALLDTHYDPATNILRIAGDGTEAQFDISTDDGRADASAKLADLLHIPVDLRPTLHSAEPHRFTDVSVVSTAMMNAVSLISVDSVALFSDTIGRQVDPARFRGNITFSGFPPLSELELENRRIQVGKAVMTVVRRTKRCPATEVNLETGQRDLNVPSLLQEHFGHSDMGIYAQVEEGGEIRPGDVIRLLD